MGSKGSLGWAVGPVAQAVNNTKTALEKTRRAALL
jgi:hypothetical protein